MKTPFLTIQPKFNAFYHGIWAFAYYFMLTMPINNFVNGSPTSFSLESVFMTAVIVYLIVIASYFYTAYTKIRFFNAHAEYSFTFFVSLKKIVSYKNIRQVDFFSGVIGNLFNLTTVKLISSATTGGNIGAGINVHFCELTDAQEEELYSQIAKHATAMA